MKQRTKGDYSKYLVLPAGAALIDLVFLFSNFDPINPVKFWCLGLLAAYLLHDLLSGQHAFEFLRMTFKRTGIALIGLFLLSMLIAFIFTDVKTIGLVGFSGRNNGLLSYLFLCIVYIYAVTRTTESNLINIYRVVTVLLGFLSIYGVLQHYSLDPLNWVTSYNKISLTVGNPDFASSLLGLLATLVFTFLFTQKKQIVRIFLLSVSVVSLLVIYWTQARQGLIVVAIGFTLILATVVWQKRKKAGYVILGFAGISAVIAILGTLQIGPLTKILYKGSINDRGYDWRAAINMFSSHPWFGVGIDRYAGSFMQYRDLKYPLIYGYQQTVNNAHNIFLQFFATCGIFVGIAYIFLVLFIAFRSVRAFKKYDGKKQILVAGVIASWITFVAQSFISVDNLSVSIWGWVLGGVVVAVSLPDDFIQADGKRLKGFKKPNKFSIQFLVPTILLIFFIPIVVLMYQGESRMSYFTRIPKPNSVSQQITYNKIAGETFNTPLLSTDNKILIAFNITNSGDIARGEDYFKRILKVDPKRSDAYQFLATIYEFQKDYEAAIQCRIAARRINPAGADNLLILEKDYFALGNKSSAGEIRDLILKIAPGTNIAAEALTLSSGH